MLRPLQTSQVLGGCWSKQRDAGCWSLDAGCRTRTGVTVLGLHRRRQECSGSLLTLQVGTLDEFVDFGENLVHLMSVDLYSTCRLGETPRVMMRDWKLPGVLGEASRCWILDSGCWVDLAVRDHASAPASSIQRGCYTKYAISFVRHYQYELYFSGVRKVLRFLAD